MSTLSLKLAARAMPDPMRRKHELSLPVCAQAIDVLNRLLVEMIDVALCARHARWNIRGRNTLTLCGTLRSLGTRLDAEVENVADRIRELGGMAHGTVQQVSTGSSFKPYPVEVTEGQDHLDALALRLGLLSAEARLAIVECKWLDDPATIEVLTAVNTAIDDLLALVEYQLLKTY